MKRAVFALIFVPAVLSAKPPPPPEQQFLDKALELAGGYSKFQRLETLTCDFEEALFTSSAPVIRKGQWALRMHDGKGVRVRERTEGGRVTVALSSGTPSPAAEALLREVFLSFIPQKIKEEDRRLETLSQGFFLGHLLDRMLVDGAPFFPGGENLILFFHKDTGHIEGVSFGAVPTYVYLRSPEVTKSLLAVPALRVYHDGTEKKTKAVKISNIMVNGYVEEGLFAPGETP